MEPPSKQLPRDLKPGERKVIADGTDGPVVEIIRKSAPEAVEVDAAARECGRQTRRQQVKRTGE